MLIQELNNKFPPSSVIRPLTLGLMLGIACLAAGQSLSAQTIQPRPVARLISSPSSNPANSRPRRVSSTHDVAEHVPAYSVAGPSFDQASEIEQRAFNKTNAERVKQGRNALVWDPQLCLLAREHSESMAQRGYFDHETPEGLQPRDRARVQGLRFRVLGENIAYNKGYDDPGAFAVQRWMISSGHRANILYVGFEASAIGSYTAADGIVYITQLFVTR